MYRDVEDVLVRELRQVADGVEVPALPTLPADGRRRSVWLPLMVAAAVLLVILGAVAAVTVLGDERQVQPAPSPSPTVATDGATEEATDTGPLSADPPSVPYIAGTRLYVGGEQVPGDWWGLQSAGTAWIATEAGPDSIYWWGTDAEPQRLEGFMRQPPNLSPDGRYLARIIDDGAGQLTIQSTEPGGEGVSAGVPVDAIQGVSYTYVPVVTNDGLVITTAGNRSMLWRALGDGATVDLRDTAPGWVVVDNSPAGVMAQDPSGVLYLVDISEEGEITPIRELPEQNEGGPAASTEWMTWPDPDEIGGEATVISRLNVERLDGSGQGTLVAPEGWLLGSAGWTWEDDDHLIASVVNDADRSRLVRCSPVTEECVLLETP